MPSQDDIDQQQRLLAMYRRNLAHYLRQQAAVGGEIFAPLSVINGISEARHNISQIKEALRSWGIIVADHPDDGAKRSVISEQDQLSATPKPVDKIMLRAALSKYFNEEELRDLALDLNIDYDDLSGSGASAKARELIMYAERNGRYEELVQYVQQQRPNINW